jgi:hypothetical protein
MELIDTYQPFHTQLYILGNVHEVDGQKSGNGVRRNALIQETLAYNI